MADVKPTASSSDDLVKRLRYLAGYQSSPTYDAMHQAADEIERLRQPVAGKVVERGKIVELMEKFRRERMAWHISNDSFDPDATPDHLSREAEADAILKLIGGGK